jgi:two-component system response regulator FixJ
LTSVYFSEFTTTMPTIAVIDPDAKERQILCDLLSAMHVDVTTYRCAEDYLEQHAVPSSCLLTSLNLPGMSGLELIRLLRGNGSNMPVILVALEADIRTAVEAMRLGATDVIEKSRLDVALWRRVPELLFRTGSNGLTGSTARP